jgi:L-ribulokinase
VGAGGYDEFDTAVAAMTGVQERIFEPIPENRATYDRLFALYRRLHDAFGVPGTTDDTSDVMKTLLQIRDESRG